MRHLGFVKAALVGVVMVTVVSSGLALAVSPFVDVPAAKFYADPVDWAYVNGITTGSPPGSDTFKPEDPVTRGENVTFAKRYDDNVVQPALSALQSADQSVHWIWFADNGVKAAGTDGVTSVRTGTGTYTLGFGNVDITDCSWSAVHRIGIGFVLPGVHDTMVSLQQGVDTFPFTVTDVDEMYVSVFDDVGAPQDGATQVQVIC